MCVRFVQECVCTVRVCVVGVCVVQVCDVLLQLADAYVLLLKLHA